VLTITGTNFGDAHDSTVVQFPANIYPAPLITPIAWTENSLTVVVPSSAETGPVQVQVDGWGSNPQNFTLIPSPTISSLSTSSGVPGTSVIVYGNNFGYSQSNSTVSFNGVQAAVSTWSNNYIAAVAPSNVTNRLRLL
jgi:hypothetical protein